MCGQAGIQPADGARAAAPAACCPTCCAAQAPGTIANVLLTDSHPTLATTHPPLPSTATASAAVAAFKQRLAEVAAQLESAKTANRAADDNMGKAIDQVSRDARCAQVAARWGGRLPSRRRAVRRAVCCLLGSTRAPARAPVPAPHLPPLSCPPQVSAELSGTSEAQRMKREQMQRNGAKAAELQAQVRGAGRPRSALAARLYPSAVPLGCALRPPN